MLNKKTREWKSRGGKYRMTCERDEFDTYTIRHYTNGVVDRVCCGIPIDQIEYKIRDEREMMRLDGINLIPCDER